MDQHKSNAEGQLNNLHYTTQSNQQTNDKLEQALQQL